MLQAPPGAGKTTTLPLAMLLSRPAWLGDGTILLLEPRRLAARAAANRMAAILGEPVGKTVGYRVRFDSKISASTRVEVVTEGILTRRLQTDPGLEGIAAVVFDEFHERSLDADLSLALTADVRAALRPELRLIVMSATLGQVGPAVASMLGEKETSSSAAPLLVSEGRSFPVETTYLGPPGRNFGDLETATVAAVRRALRENPGPEGGDVLCFLPGAGEINRVVSALRDDGVVALPLHSGLSREDQAAALAPAPPGTRRVVVSTPIAESSLTIPGVRVVVDSGLRRAPRFDPRKGMTRLDVVLISRASADQRRGRAGRVAPGACYRMWSEVTHAALGSDDPPEIKSADLAPLALDLASWGADPSELPWLDPPPEGQLDAARDLLRRLGAIERGANGRVAVTPAGRRMANLPLHPRMARMVLWGASRGPESARLACQVAAVLGDRDVLRGRDAPADIRCRLGAMWDANGKGARLVASAPTSSPPPPPPPTSAATPVRVPIGTKVDSGRKKRGKMKGAPRGKKPAGGGAAAAARAARAAPTRGGSSANSASPFDAHEGFEIDRAAAREAGKVAEQLLGALGRLARSDADDAWRAPGVGEGDPTGPVFPFLLGEGVDEVGALLAMAYPDRVGVRRSGRGAFQLSGGSGAANVPDSDPLSREAILAVAELSGDVAGGARNDRARLAAPVPASALEPGGCLHEHLCETRDRVAWAVASKAVVARRLLAVGEAVLRETPYAPEPEETVPAMLEGVRAMGARTALGWSDDTEKWRRRVTWLRRVAEGGADETLPDLGDDALDATMDEWLAPLLPGVASVSALRKLDVDGLLRCMLTYEQQRAVDDACPTHVVAPSGSKLPIDYDAPGGTPVLRARLQELFGLSESPRVGIGGTVAVEVHLLSPASRPVQVTTDLASFWADAYHDVAKEMRGRYPKHYWPEDPTTAEATHRAKPKKRK